MENFNDSNKRNVLLIVIGFLIVVLIFVYCFWYFNIRGNSEFSFIGDINQEVVFAEDIGLNLKEEALALSLKYDDVIGWLRVPGTSIDEAVFQSSDNDTYLRNDRDGTYTLWGETFLDYRNDIDDMYDMKNFVIYGHNTEEDSGFTPLLNYQDEDYFETHKYIEFSTTNENYVWEIFTVYKTDTSFFYIDTVFADDYEYLDFLNQCKDKSIYNTGVSISKDDTILTLSTCEYSASEGRFVIQAKLVE